MNSKLQFAQLHKETSLVVFFNKCYCFLILSFQSASFDMSVFLPTYPSIGVCCIYDVATGECPLESDEQEAFNNTYIIRCDQFIGAYPTQSSPLKFQIFEIDGNYHSFILFCYTA